MRILPLARKEFKDLIRERVVLFGMIIGPLIIFGVMGGVMGLSFKSIERETLKPVKVAIMVYDNSTVAEMLVDFVRERASEAVIVSPGDPIDALRRLFNEEGIEALVVVPRGFGYNISRGIPGVLEEYIYISNPSFVGIPSASKLTAYISEFNKLVLLEAVKRVYPNATLSFIASPVVEKSTILLYGEPVGGPEELMRTIFAQVFILPLMLFTAVMAAIQVAAVSMAVEKEAKTLEMLLTLPVSRVEILLGKLLGVSVIAVIGAASYTLGFLVYMSVTPGVGSSPLSLSIGPAKAALYFLALLLGLLISIGIGILTSVFVGDVKSAQIASSYISFPLVLPVFVFMFGVNVEELPVGAQAVLMLDPYVHMLKAFLGIVSGDHIKTAIGMGGMLVYLVILMFAASRLFNSERILTARFSLRRRAQDQAPIA